MSWLQKVKILWIIENNNISLCFSATELTKYCVVFCHKKQMGKRPIRAFFYPNHQGGFLMERTWEQNMQHVEW